MKLDELKSITFDVLDKHPIPRASKRHRPSEIQYAVLVALAEGGSLPTQDLRRTVSAMRQRGWVVVSRSGPRITPIGRYAYRVEWRRRADDIRRAEKS